MGLSGVKVKRGLATGALVLVMLAGAVSASAQDRLATYPGAAQYAAWAPKIRSAVKPGTVLVGWASSGQSFDYVAGPPVPGAQVMRFDLASRTSSKIAAASGEMRAPAAGIGRGGADLSGRGAYAREHTTAAPEGDWKAFTRNKNIFLSHADGSDERPVTTDGSTALRIRNGVPTYVYTEELALGEGMWWSPNGTKLAYMRFDEGAVPDYPLQMEQTKPYSTTRTIAYPSPGSPNPIPDLFVYDVVSGTTVHVDVRDGQPFNDAVVGHYIWQVAWSPDNAEVRLLRANRLQSIIDWIGCSPQSGACRIIDRESQPGSWATAGPRRFLGDGRRFILTSNRNGWDNLYLCDIDGTQLNPITANTTFEVGNIVRVDEAAGVVWYMARDGDDYLKMKHLK